MPFSYYRYLKDKNYTEVRMAPEVFILFAISGNVLYSYSQSEARQHILDGFAQ